MEALAIYKRAPISAQKARLVADQVRGLSAESAIELLTFSNKKAAKLVKKVLDSAIANAEENESADLDDLMISSICVDEGPTAKRFMARARGRANQILKRTCHIKVVVSDNF